MGAKRQQKRTNKTHKSGKKHNRKGTRHAAKRHNKTHHSRPSGGIRRNEPLRQGKQSIDLTLLETEAERTARIARTLGTAIQEVRQRETVRAALAAQNPANAMAMDIALLNNADLRGDALVSGRTGDQPTMERALETLGALGRAHEELNTRLIQHLNTMRNRHDRGTHLRAARDIAPIAHVVLTTGVGPLLDHALPPQDGRDWRELHGSLRTIATHQGLVQDSSTNRWRMAHVHENLHSTESDPFLATATIAAILRAQPRPGVFEGMRLVASPTDAPEDIVTEAARRQGRSPPPPPGSGSTFVFEAPDVPPQGFSF
jgi:hypothetical protein